MLIKVLTAGVAVTEEEIWHNYKTKNESVKLEYVVGEIEKIELKEEKASFKKEGY